MKAELSEKGIEFEYVEITENVKNLRAFLKIRDTAVEFQQIRKSGRIGIPCIEKDGEILLDDVDKLLK